MMTPTGAKPINTTQPVPTSANPVMRQPAPGTVTPVSGSIFEQSGQALQTGMNTAAGAAAYQPMMVGAQTVNPAMINTGAVNQTTSAYMNPYTQQVTDVTMQQLAEQQAMAMNNLDAQASAAGAFGGSRHGVAMGSTMGEYADAQAQALANLNFQGYTTAQQQAMQQQLANQGAMNTASLANQQAGLTAGLANQSAGLQGANLNLNAANSLGGLSNLGFGQGMAVTNQQAAIGAQEQAMQQAQIDAAMAQYYASIGYPVTSTSQLYPAAQMPTGSTTTGTSTYNPGLFDYMSLGLSF
jgi:hypothetical protein